MTEGEEIMIYCEEKRFECKCSCHGSNGAITHMVACCQTCGHCGIRVVRGGMKRHYKRLHPDEELSKNLWF